MMVFMPQESGGEVGVLDRSLWQRHGGQTARAEHVKDQRIRQPRTVTGAS